MNKTLASALKSWQVKTVKEGPFGFKLYLLDSEETKYLQSKVD